MRYFRVPTLLLLFLTGAVMFAQDESRPGTADIKLNLTHGTNLVVHTTDNGNPGRVKDRQLKDNAAKNEFFVPHDADVTVVIERPNPILYKYEVKDLKQEKTVTAGALEDLGAALKTLSEGFAGLQANRVTLAGARVIKNAPGANIPDCDEARVTGLSEFLDVAGTIATNAARVDSLTRDSYETPDDVRMTVKTEFKVDEWQKTFDDAYKQLSASAVAILGGQNRPCEGRVALALTKAPDIRETLTKLKTFRDLALKLNQPLDLQTFTVDRSQFTTFKVTVAKTDAFPKAINNTRFIGERSVRVNPDERVKVAALAGAVYSWVDSAEYTAVESGDKFKIVETDKDTTGFALEAGVEFAPRAWDFGGFDGVVQLGVAPKDDLGLFLGLGIKTGRYSFGAGVAMHQVKVLSGGLTVGQEIATKDDLKTDEEFKSGPYVFFSFKP